MNSPRYGGRSRARAVMVIAAPLGEGEVGLRLPSVVHPERVVAQDDHVPGGAGRGARMATAWMKVRQSPLAIISVHGLNGHM